MRRVRGNRYDHWGNKIQRPRLDAVMESLKEIQTTKKITKEKKKKTRQQTRVKSPSRSVKLV
jgi:hypothetical protein